MTELHLSIQLAVPAATIPSEKQFIQWVTSALSDKTPSAEICIRIVDKTESAALNTKYRQKSGPTNVLSFNSGLPPEMTEHCLFGDLVICADLVAEEAAAENLPIEDHWAHLVIHGCLHLLGYDHELDKEAEIMEKLETDIMLKLGLADPYSQAVN